MTRNLTGPPVSGDDFFDREGERKVIWDSLKGEHLLVLAPRRVGKTSLMYRLKEEAPAEGFRAIYCSAAEATNEVGFIEALVRSVSEVSEGSAALRELQKANKRWFKPVRGFLSRIRGVQAFGFGVDIAAAEKDWAALGEALAGKLALQSRPWLLMIDELPLFVMRLLQEDESGTRARDFLTWLRSLRQRPSFLGRVQWFFAGSIGLDAVAARYRMGDTINDLKTLALGPFTREVAKDFLLELAKAHRLPLDPSLCELILDRVGWPIPYHLQIVFGILRSLVESGGEPPSPAMVDQAFEQLLGPSCKAYFDYWRQRLTDELGRPDDAMAMALLETVARSPSPVSQQVLVLSLSGSVPDAEERATKGRFLLDVLENDGYLVAENGQYRFRSSLLLAFWKRRILA